MVGLKGDIYFPDTTLNLYQAWEGEARFGGSVLPSKQNWAFRPQQGKQYG